MAFLTLDRLFHLLTFSYENVSVTFSISHKITEILPVYYDKTGYIEVETNCGEDGIDILYNTKVLTKAEKNKLEHFFETEGQEIKVRYV